MGTHELDPTEVNTFRSYVTMLGDSSAKDEIKLKAAQELSEHFEVIVQTASFPSFLEHSLKIFVKILQDGEPQFISENTVQHIREFLSFVKKVYTDLPMHVPKIFESAPQIRVKDLKELDFEKLLLETYAAKTIYVEKITETGTVAQGYTFLPKGFMSLRVLQELPIIVVLIYQIYKNTVHQEVADFVPLIMTTITLQPSLVQRTSPAFNKEIFVDFMGAQIKTLSFLAYIVRIFQDSVVSHSPSVVKGMLGLMELCPKEAANLRKELLIAARHIFATDLRLKFIPYIDRMFDEDLLIGKGVTLDSIRPLAYSTLADLAHHVRENLSLKALAKAANLFSKNVHDESLATGIQTMSCKLLMNLVDCIRQHSESDPVKARELLITLLKVFTSKFQSIAKIQLPMIMQKWKNIKDQQTPANTSGTIPAESTPASSETKEGVTLDSPPFDQTVKANTLGIAGTNSLNVAEYRCLVKTLVGGVKTITWGCVSCKPMIIENKLFLPHELSIYIDLIYWALETLDIYTVVPNIPIGLNQIPKPSGHIPRTKEEKEVLEHFSGIFLMMHSQNFQEIFATTIEYMVERIYKNSSIQVVANSFLANPSTSPLFATVLVEYLLERMEEMGSNVERSNLYLRLFKLVFGSVSLFPIENEQMLRPHLHNIVNRSMELAMTAKEPFNYFLLLRALFRSIGGGSHDLLYQEFLPLLPNLLEGLNRLQSGFHKQHMKDLFVELCLTVPVRLSSLLPYLPMLMDPLVSALNGSQNLISQGLRTLELCVDNLQPDFLYDHIQPVRADLMQALWRTLRNQDSAAMVAFRVLGKFGGGNRKMMIEAQKLEYNDKDTPTSAIVANFQDHRKSIDFPVDKVIEIAFNALNLNATDSFYRKQSWVVIRCFLAASISLEDEKHILQNLFIHPSFVEANINVLPTYYKSDEVQARQTHQTALTGMLVAAATKELRESVLPFMVSVVRHYTMVAVAQQSGPFPLKHNINNTGLDPLVLIDALAVCMGHEEKELCKPGQLCISLILKTTTNILGNKERACRLPLMQYLAERMVALCYERPWYAKMGGCMAIECLYQHMSLCWLYQNLFAFLRAFIFVIMDLGGEVSSGTIDMAKTYLENMLRISMVPLDKDYKNKELVALQTKTMYEIIHELVRQVTSPNTLVREQAMSSLRLIAELQKKTVTEVMDPHREVLVDIIPPQKHFLRHQPASAQIGLMDGNTFCTTLEPRLFTINLANTYHKLFFDELLILSEAEDSILTKLDCYKNVTNLIPLRKSALRALAACHYINEVTYREKIINILFKVMDNNNTELQEVAFECMQKFLLVFQIEKEKVRAGMRPLLLTLGDHRNLNLTATKRLSYFTQLFPSMFNEKLSEQILQHCQEMIEISVNANKTTKQGGHFLAVAKVEEYEQKIAILIGMFHQISAATPKYIESLCQLVLKTENNLMMESCPYRKPLVKFLLRYPNDSVNLFLTDLNVLNPQWNRFLIYMLKHKDGLPFRNAIQSNKSVRLMQLINCNCPSFAHLNEQQKYEVCHQGVLIVYNLMEQDDQWLLNQMDIVAVLKNLWQTSLYRTCETNVACDLWHLVGKILLFYFSHNTNDIDLLFQLLRALCLHFIPDFHFLRDFLQNTVAQSFTVSWKRNAFFHFVENFNSPLLSEDLKAKILTAILIPCFAVSFEKGEGNKLIGAPPTPYQEDDNNIVSVFISKVFDPEKPFANDDAVRIALLQFACLLVDKASPHIHDGDANNKRQSNKLRRLMTFAWPCLLSKNCVDPTARYHGHLLLSHIIARLAIHKKIVLQVFHSLLKGHALEARPVVRQALEVLTPAMPLRMEDGNTMLTHWTKKIIVEEGHSMQQLFHILQLIVRHYKVYYPVRHHLVQHMINYMQRLGFPPNASLDNRKLSVELAETIIRWELQRIKEGISSESDTNVGEEQTINCGPKRASVDDPNEVRKKFAAGESVPTQQPISSNSTTSAAAIQHQKIDEIERPIEKVQCDNVLNFLVRLACQVNDVQSTPGVVSPGETLSRRCVMLLKTAIRPEVWLQPFDLKLTWLDKVFASVDTPQANLGNICTGLELLTFFMSVLRKDHVLGIIRPIQRGLSACVTNQNTRIIRLMHALMSRLMSLYPADSHHKHENLEVLYTTVSTMITDSFNAYEKSQQSISSTLFGALMILKACCNNNPSYIDRIMLQFMRVLNRLTKDHMTIPNTGPNAQQPIESGSLSVELLILSLDLIKNRTVVMGIEIRKLFIGGILVGLIEKSNDPKILKCIIKMIEDWMKNKAQALPIPQTPSIREKSILLVKLMQYVEKRFADDLELNAQFLELINYMYRDDYLKQTELTSKLEVAFLTGLRCTQPSIRFKFFEIFDGSMRRRLHDRLLYIICSQAWDSIGPHYWIKQCIELLILTANTNTQIQNSNENHLVPSISSIINLADTEEKKHFVIYTPLQIDTIENILGFEEKDDLFDIDINTASNVYRHEDSERNVANRQASLVELISKQSEFLHVNRQVRTEHLLAATSQLCHMDTQLAEKMWLAVFPRLWSMLDEDQQQAIMRELIPFLSSGSHVIQKDCHPSALNTFVEAVIQCKPPIYIPPSLLAYLGKAHNLWHRMSLILEDMATDWQSKKDQYQEISDIDLSEYDLTESSQSNICDSLSQMYSALHEEDLWAGLWLRYAKYPETNTAIAFEQMGFFEEAQNAYDLAMCKFKQEVPNGPIALEMNSELVLWENHWIRCAKELNQWDILLDYAQSNKDKKPLLIMESAWRVPNWTLMKQALNKVEQINPKQYGFKVNLYKGFLAILNQEEQQLSNVERHVEIASGMCMREWRRLPQIVSHIHLQYLQTAQQIMELQEACQIHQGLIQAQGRNSSLHDMKAIVKTWRNRLPVIADDLSHWSDIFTWRQHHYQIITQHLEQQTDQGNTMLGVHASAQAIIYFGKIARKHNLTSVCQESLSRIYTIPSVPIVDCFQKIRQQVKCNIQMASVGRRAELNEALEVIESTNLKYFSPENNAELYALKGLLLAQIGRSDEANKAFSAAAKLHDGLTKAWALWGDYLDQIFTSKPRQMMIGVSAITCFLHACRHQNENKTRKYLAKVLWLLAYDDSKASLMDALEKYVVGVPPLHWLPWIPQLLCCLVQYEGKVILNLLSHVGRMYPQAVYFPIRTLFLTMKIEQRERHKATEQANKMQIYQQQADEQSGEKTSSSQNTQQTIKATSSMWRCSKVMHVQREIHPTILSSIEGIVDQMVWFRESWTEEVLRQLRQGLIKCYAIAFENKSAVNKATITPHTLHFVKKLVSTFGIGIENISGSLASSSTNSAASESFARRTQITFQDPVFQIMKGQFTNDFDFSQPGAMKLHYLITKLRKWIKILETKVKKLPTSFLIEDKCRFLSNFSQKTAEVELPGELLLPGPSHYHIRIARFMPRVDIVQKNNTAARRLYIRGTNGKIYPYLVVIESGLGDARREERVLQFLRMLNQYLDKQKETSRRFLNITVPRVVPISAQMRLAQDNPASISLREIYKMGCSKLGIEHETPIVRYYDRLAEVQARGTQTTHTVLRDILREVQATMVPKTMLMNWAVRNFQSPTHYWQFRKMFTLQLSLAFLCEYAFHLTRLNADMMYLHQDSGLMNISYYKFDVDDGTGDLDANRPVPFRLTPNITEFVTKIGISGPLSASIVATARCFVQPNFKLTSILQAILLDEIIGEQKKRIKDERTIFDASGEISLESVQKIDMENIIRIVTKIVAAVMLRLNDVANFEKGDLSKINSLLQSASNPDNLCRMDPAWHPWL
ncbi:transcription-associated protein 1 isoform X2 [Episyrphus balteatus]|uniref:transcription-associated protein 1 isoform X2 n=1 Tax=Episyrphus balteatus TaxID=286459 RepID=UPI002485C714|nr:transcription-associated protein 1 isoform X2 [Episyrphus balteatus]